MKHFLRKENLKRKMPGWITYPVLVLFSFVFVWTAAYFYIPHALSASLPYTPKPFEGNITYIQYNCLCSGAIMLTIKPTTAHGLSNQGPSLNLMYFWAADALSQVLDIPGPRIYAFWQIFYPGDQQLLGMYFPYTVPCMAYTGNGCAQAGSAQGVLMTTGTSLPW